MEIRFLQPYFLVLLLAIPVLWFVPRRAPRRLHAALRSIAFAALIIALARPVLLTADTRTYHVLVLDRSASLGADGRRQQDRAAQQLLETIPSKDPTSVVLVGSGAAPTSSTSPAPAPASSASPAPASSAPPSFRGVATTIAVDDGQSGSPLSAGLAAAARLIPEGSQGVVSLFSDGLATDRRWAPAIERLIERGLRVDTYDAGRNEEDVYPVNLAADGLLRAGQTVRATVDLVGRAAAVRARLLDANGQELAVSAPVAPTDGRATIPLTFEAKDAGFLPITVRAEVVDGRDANPRNNDLRRTLAVQDPLRVLYLGNRMQQGAARLDDLLGRGFDITDGTTRPLDDRTDLTAFDLVIVDDRPASRMPEAFQQRLLASVRDRGVGLLFSGGKASFGTGGYDQSTVAKMLPVEFVQRTEKRDPSTALVVIIDTSGSMTGSRIELAKQVTRLAIRRLKAHDRVGIVEFYGNKHWALPLQSAANKITIDRAVGRMQAVGGTVLLPGVEEAYYGLKNVQTRYKHILIITDAGVEDADFEAMLRLVTKDGVNVSTVLVGAQAHNQIMIDMASWGKGRFYSAADRYALPELILKQPATMKLPAYKTGAFSVQTRGGEGWWADIDRRAMPALNGYVEITSRPGAEVLMETGESTDPLLTSWRYGLGRVTTMMTEPVGEGTQGWSDWKEYGRLLARIASRTADDQPPFAYDVSRDDHELTVRARRYSTDAALRPRAAVVDASGRETAALAFRELAPGQFGATLVAKPGEDVRLVATTQRGSVAATTAATRVNAAASQDLSPEQQVDPERGIDLEALAAATGGRYVAPDALASGELPAASTQSAAGREPSIRLIRLWPAVLLVALIVYLADIIYRRWPYMNIGAARV